MEWSVLHIAKLMLVLLCYHKVAEGEKQSVKKTYIIHMDKANIATSVSDYLEWYQSSLRSVADTADMLYTYKNVLDGFSARLAEEEAALLEQQPGVLSVRQEMRYELHTTRTPEFLGLGVGDTVFSESKLAAEVIVGVLDTGVWPELKSFDDTGLGPVRSTWKGTCEVGKNFNSTSCNRKLVGARYFSKAYEGALGSIDESMESKSPRDDDGHGTHTSTTAAGSAVEGASVFGFAPGKARGMAPQARVAIYKVCWLGGCFGSDILAAIDMAVEDGVDILSMSIGGGLTDYYRDIVSLGAFKAMEHGIFVSCSAGNAGPSSESVTNVAPWITTVGAGTLDRDFPAYVTLGNGKKYTGVSLYSGKPLSNPVPVVFAGNVSRSSNDDLCMTGTLIPSKVAGKIVVCNRGGNARAQKGMVVRKAGGIGMILTNTEYYGEELVADAHLLPTAAMGQTAGDEIKKYVFSDSQPIATVISGGTRVGIQPSPVVAAFSSRGPNALTRQILKPDLLAPGVNILAGWSGRVGPTGIDSDKRYVNFNIISGTSMSCPHVGGLAALIKGAHPEWSPAAIRSALMTTAYTIYKDGKTIEDFATGSQSTPFDYGAGHVDPMAALDPGLVYDAKADDYLSFLCALKYSSVMIKLATNKAFTCDSSIKYGVENLNYPSFAVPLDTASSRTGGAGVVSTVRYTRTLTNVGTPATYKVSVLPKTPSVKILVEPESLTFNKAYEKKSYTVTFTASSMPSGTTLFARLEWSDGKHVVGSPIAFSWT